MPPRKKQKTTENSRMPAGDGQEAAGHPQDRAQSDTDESAQDGIDKRVSFDQSDKNMVMPNSQSLTIFHHMNTSQFLSQSLSLKMDPARMTPQTKKMNMIFLVTVDLKRFMTKKIRIMYSCNLHHNMRAGNG